MFSEKLKEHLDELKELNELHKEVIEDIISDLDGEETDEALYEALDQITTHGCVSGIVDSMIYYSDTVAFFERHKYTINDMLSEYVQETGASMKEIFKKYDDEDPLCLESYNQNLLAWYAYESVAMELFTMLEEIK